MSQQISQPTGPDQNGAYQCNGWDIQQTGAGDWRCSVIDEDGDYLQNEYFDTKAKALAHARKEAS
ncbi:hypothetical protein [Roseococcus pinisoli]|uniref:DUF2188 domain-containing protein n=1 Tax=Roseococcus pinisoli TaxID=2835040 RepID=A0ABS5QF02_9PROT|nr:hypothetical protein [Roseococcus pinisoli]MBS7812279.1 hypothetical protein [Roseococcus pinisoli]